MKILFTLVFSFLFTVGFAQSEYNFYSYIFSANNSNASFYMSRVIPPEGTKTIQYEVKNTKNGKVKTYKNEYNEDGKMLYFGEIVEGELVYKTKNEFDENGFLKQQERFTKNGKMWSRTTAKRRDFKEFKDGEIVEYANFNSRGKLKTFSTWDYKASGCLSESKTYTKQGEKLKKRWVYEYYKECDKKSSTLYNGKGKVLQVWSYDCKKEGEQLEKKKDETQFCKWEESDGKYLIRVSQSFDEKGNTTKWVAKYTLADTLILESKHFNSKDELTSESTYDKDYKKQLTFKNYKKGKLKYSTEYKYENDHITYFSRSRNNQIVSKAEYSYEGDQMVILKLFGKKDELAKIVSYQYN